GRAAPLPALAAARLRPRAPPRRGALPLRARDDRVGYAGGGRHAVRRVRLARARGAGRGAQRGAGSRGRRMTAFDARRAAGADRPLRLEGSALYLDRYWREEHQVAADLLALRARPPAGVDEARLADGLDRLFGGEDLQRTAAETAVRRRFTVVAGGPGTGKT